jgi:hypothetical protein
MVRLLVRASLVPSGTSRRDLVQRSDNGSMAAESNLKLFFSYSSADMDARRTRDLLRQEFDVTSQDTLTGSFARRTALHQAVADCDIVVAVLPPPEDPASRNVFIEAGVAIGAGRPLLLLGDPSAVPVDLAGIPVANSEWGVGLADTIRQVAAAGPAIPSHPAVEDDGAALAPAIAEQWRERLEARGLKEIEAIGVLDDVFRMAGARSKNASVAGYRMTDVPDLAIWHDGLTATLGTPLPVEILVRATSWPAVRQRLERTLRASGGRTLLALYLGPAVDVPRIWSDGSRTILVVAATDLVGELQAATLPVAMARLVERAEP